MSKGGKPILAMPSRTHRGTSRLVSNIQEGAGVVTTRCVENKVTRKICHHQFVKISETTLHFPSFSYSQGSCAFHSD